MTPAGQSAMGDEGAGLFSIERRRADSDDGMFVGAGVRRFQLLRAPSSEPGRTSSPPAILSSHDTPKRSRARRRALPASTAYGRVGAGTRSFDHPKRF